MKENLKTKMEDIIRKTIVENMNKEYDEYKQKCLEELNQKFEYKRNKILADILDRLSIEISEETLGVNPIINVRIETRPIIKKEEI